jgi:AcrR family transcriptional regulator
MADTAELVAFAKGIDGLNVVALVPNARGAERAVEAGVDAMSIPFSMSETHSIRNVRKDHPAMLAEIAEAAGVSRQAVYLHFGDRAGLFVALVDHIDQSLGSAELRAKLFGAPSGVESLRRWVETMSWYTQRIDVVSRVLEHAQYEDKALRAAWRNRMHRRHDDILTRVVDRIHAEGDLAAGWKSTTLTDRTRPLS